MDLVSIDVLAAQVKELGSVSPKSIYEITVTNVHTQEVTHYTTKVDAAKALGCDEEAIRENRKNLYKKVYDIKVVSKA